MAATTAATTMAYLLICMIAIGIYGFASAEEALHHEQNIAADVAGDAVTAENIKGKMSDVASDEVTNVVVNTAGSAYETAKVKLGEAKEELRKAYETAKQTMSEDAKTMYEAAKEKVSQATGDLGEKIENKKEEL